MLAKITCKSGMLAKTEFLVRGSLTIGAAARNDVIIKKKTVSNRHARIFYDKTEKRYFLEDLQSHNGTQLDGVPIKAPQRLGVVHVLTIADKFDFIFQPVLADGPSVAPAPAKTPVPVTPATASPVTIIEHLPFDSNESHTRQRLTAPATIMEEVRQTGGGNERYLSAENLHGDGQLCQTENEYTASQEYAVPEPTWPQPAEQQALSLLIPAMQEKFVLGPGEHLIGRAVACAITINHHSVSRQHALIRVREHSMVIEDLGSKNHTLLADRRLQGQTEIGAGHALKFGQVEAIVTQEDA